MGPPLAETRRARWAPARPRAPQMQATENADDKFVCLFLCFCLSFSSPVCAVWLARRGHLKGAPQVRRENFHRLPYTTGRRTTQRAGRLAEAPRAELVTSTRKLKAKRKRKGCTKVGPPRVLPRARVGMETVNARSARAPDDRAHRRRANHRLELRLSKEKGDRRPRL